MGNFDPNYKRLGIIIFIFVVLTLIYSCEHVFFNVAQQNILDEPLYTLPDEDYYNKTKVEDSGINIIGMFQFMTFTIPEIPIWMMVFLTPFSIILNIVLWYLIADVIYDIIKALPFT
jgi:hypothetical protein